MTYDKSEFVKKTDEIRARIKQLQEDYKKEAQAAFAEATKGFFDEVPFVEGLHWVQYTPWFNDGDECYFSVHDIGNWIKGEDFNDVSPYGDEGGINTSSWGTPTTAASLASNFDIEVSDDDVARAKAALESIISFIGSIEDSVMEDMFGNHVRVVVTRDGVRTDEYEHD